jgi:Domain of unknown function (DUF5122) beta-propeller
MRVCKEQSIVFHGLLALAALHSTLYAQSLPPGSRIFSTRLELKEDPTGLRAAPDGAFYLFGQGTASWVHRCDADGFSDDAFNTSPGATATDGVIHDLAVMADGRLILAGAFGSIGGARAPGIARLSRNGSVDSSYSPGIEKGSVIYAVCPLGDGTLVIQGSFSMIEGIPRSGLARLNANGSLDRGFDPPALDRSKAHLLSPAPGGGVFIGGRFDRIAGEPRNGLALIGRNGEL